MKLNAEQNCLFESMDAAYKEVERTLEAHELAKAEYQELSRKFQDSIREGMEREHERLSKSLPSPNGKPWTFQ